MKRDFVTVKLGEVLTRRKDEIDIQELDFYKRLTIRMNGQGIELRDCVPGSQIGTKKQFAVESGQIVLSKIDARNGAFGILPEACDGAIITGNFWAFDINTAILHPQYFNYLTKTHLFVDFCIRASDGTTNRLYLQESKFLEMEIPLPPIAEQRRIVARIEELAAKIEEARGLRKRAIEECDTLCRSILFLGGGDKKLTPMHELVRLREPDIEVKPSVTYKFAGVYSFGRGVFKQQGLTGMEFSYKNLTKLRTGDFVYPKLMAWEGALGIVPESCNGLVVSPEFPVFEVDKEKVLPETLDVYFRTSSVWTLLSGISSGTNIRRRRLHPSRFLEFEMPLPDMTTQQLLKKVKAKTDQMKLEREKALIELDALLPAILDKAFKGAL